MSSLFEITNDLQMLYEMATDPECDPRELDDTIEGTLGALEIKAGGYANVIKTLEMEQDQAKKIAQEFTKKATVRENSIKRMKAALLQSMEQLGMAELPAGDFIFKVQKNGGKEPLVIDDPASVPDNLTKVTIEPDKDKIREYLKDKTCDWAHIEPRGKHIVIK